MIRLAALDGLLTIVCTMRELVWPVHPVDAGINVMLVACPNLQNTRHPVIVRLLPRLDRSDKALAEVLDAVDCSQASDG